jgi:hypothetical protein
MAVFDRIVAVNEGATCATDVDAPERPATERISSGAPAFSCAVLSR